MTKTFFIEFMADENSDNDFIDFEQEVVEADSEKQAIEILEELRGEIEITAIKKLTNRGM